MVEEIQELYAYNRWANRRVLDACAPLPPEWLARGMGSSFPSVLATLAHILAGEWIWLERWCGRSPTALPDGWGQAGLAALRKRWTEVERAQEAFLLALTPERLEAEVRYRTTEGEQGVVPLRLLLRHLVNHSTYHRGQVAVLLRQLGAAPPATDLVLFYRERTAPEPADPAPPLPAGPRG